MQERYTLYTLGRRGTCPGIGLYSIGEACFGFVIVGLITRLGRGGIGQEEWYGIISEKCHALIVLFQIALRAISVQQCTVCCLVMTKKFWQLGKRIKYLRCCCTISAVATHAPHQSSLFENTTHQVQVLACQAHCPSHP